MKNNSRIGFMALLALLMFACSPEDGMDGATGPQGPQGEIGPQGPEGLQGPPSFTAYFELDGLNTAGITATDTWSPIGPSLIFEKSFDDTKIETVLNSRCTSGTFIGALGVLFEIRIDGNQGELLSRAAITSSNTIDFLSILDYFEELPAGNHEIQIYARTNTGTAVGVVLDQGGWGGTLIVKEIY